MPVTFNRKGPRERVSPTSQFQSELSADVPKGEDRSTHTGEPQRGFTISNRRTDQGSYLKSKAEGRETAEVAPEETQAADTKPAPRKRTTSKTTAKRTTRKKTTAKKSSEK